MCRKRANIYGGTDLAIFQLQNTDVTTIPMMMVELMTTANATQGGYGSAAVLADGSRWQGISVCTQAISRR